MHFFKRQIVEVYRELYRKGYVSTLSGNISVRIGGRIIITPSYMPKHMLTLDDLVVIDHEGNVVEGYRKPSSEWRMHVAVYRSRDDVYAVVHTHNPTVVALYMTGHRFNNPLSEARYYLGGEPVYVPYAESGTWELAMAVADALRSANVAVLERHGVVAVGRDIWEALNRVDVMEDIVKATLVLRGLAAT